MSYTQSLIMEYLRGARTATVPQIVNAVQFEHRCDASTVRATLCRMNRNGLVERPQHGVYMLVRDDGRMDRIIVAGVLDRLEKECGPALTLELERRGWTR